MRLPASSQATQLARQAIKDQTPLEGYEDLSFVGQLLTTELVGNALRHSKHDVETIGLFVECDDEILHVEVEDWGTGFYPLSEVDRSGPRAHHGLHLLDALADRWGFRRGPSSCRLWFDLDVVPGRRPWRGRVPVRASR